MENIVKRIIARNDQKITNNKDYECNLKEIQLCIEETTKNIFDKLYMTDIKTLNKPVLILITKGIHQLRSLLEDIDCDNVFRHIAKTELDDMSNNIHVEILLFQMKFLQKLCPMALFIWILVLIKINQSVYNSLPIEFYDFIEDHWKHLAKQYLDYYFFDKGKISVYQRYLVSHLVDSLK